MKSKGMFPVNNNERGLELETDEVLPDDPILLQIYKRILTDLTSTTNIFIDELSKFSSVFPKVLDFRYSRDNYVKNFSWSIPNLSSLLTIREECSKIVEIYSGTGYWAYFLNLLGCEIECYDDFSWDLYYKKFGLYFETKNINSCSLESLINCNLMIGWPPYSDNRCLEYLKIIQPRKLIYIGEVYGCCGTEQFFDYIENNFKLKKKIELSRWGGIHDSVQIWEKLE